MELDTLKETLAKTEMKLFTKRGNIRAIGNGKLYINGGTMKEGGSDIPMGEHTVVEFGNHYMRIYCFSGNVNKVDWDNPFYVGMVATEMYNLRTEKISSLKYYEWSE